MLNTTYVSDDADGEEAEESEGDSEPTPKQMKIP